MFETLAVNRNGQRWYTCASHFRQLCTPLPANVFLPQTVSKRKFTHGKKSIYKQCAIMTTSFCINYKQIEMRWLQCNGCALIRRIFCFVYGKTRRGKKTIDDSPSNRPTRLKRVQTFNNIVYVFRINNRQFVGTSARTFCQSNPTGYRLLAAFRRLFFTFRVERFSNGGTGGHSAKTFRVLRPHTCLPIVSPPICSFCYCFHSSSSVSSAADAVGSTDSIPARCPSNAPSGIDHNRKRLPTSIVLSVYDKWYEPNACA